MLCLLHRVASMMGRMSSRNFAIRRSLLRLRQQLQMLQAVAAVVKQQLLLMVTSSRSDQHSGSNRREMGGTANSGLRSCEKCWVREVGYRLERKPRS